MDIRSDDRKINGDVMMLERNASDQTVTGSPTIDQKALKQS